MEGVQRPSERAQQSSPRANVSTSVEQFGRTTPLRVVLLVVVVGELLALSRMPNERMAARNTLLRQYYHARTAWLMRGDPPLGQPLATSDVGLRVAPGAAGIIAISDCTGCSLRAVHDFAERLQTRHIGQLYAFSPREPTPKSRELMQNQCRRAGVQAELTWDRRGAARRRLNAFFAPRACIISATGRLDWLQRPGQGLAPGAN
jgi:hypothetical protein